MPVTINVNGVVHTIDTEPDTPLLWAIRDHMHLTGTKFGCGMSLCGACVPCTSTAHRCVPASHRLPPSPAKA
jgi:aerobic-type carbon monoxide dehydrogenase small subunit (CoxS/CutS family)